MTSQEGNQLFKPTYAFKSNMSHGDKSAASNLESEISTAYTFSLTAVLFNQG
jgi:hypothetical protein